MGFRLLLGGLGCLNVRLNFFCCFIFSKIIKKGCSRPLGLFRFLSAVVNCLTSLGCFGTFRLFRRQKLF